MKNVSDLSLTPDENGLVWLDAMTCDEVRLTGLPWKEKNKNYHRMDDEYFDDYPLGVQIRSNNTSGVQATVRTDSRRIALHIKLNKPDFMEHMTDNGVGGVDVFRGDGLAKRFWHIGSNFDRCSEYTHIFDADGTMIDYTFNLPLYSGVTEFAIGVESTANLENPTPYAVEKPVLFYGSSITQGGCASRPGNCYTNMVSRMLNIPIISFGFSSNCRGDDILAERINELDLSAFVYDYDHNAPNAEFLEKTHEKFFRMIRSQHPDLPIILMSKPDYDDDPVSGEERKAVILRTYAHAIAEGDRNVYFIDGSTIFGDDLRDACTVDRNHPTDLGFSRMAKAVAPVLRKVLGL